MENLQELAKIITTAREKKDISQRQLAMQIGISNTEISYIEKCQRQKPDPTILRKISQYLNIDYIELMELAGYIQDGDIPLVREKQKTLKEDLDSVRAKLSNEGLTEADKEEIMRIALEVQLEIMKKNV